MRNILFASLLILAALTLQAQAPNIIGSSPGLPTFDPTPIAATLGQSSAWNKWADSSLTSLGQHLATDESNISAIQTAIQNLPEGQQGPAGPQGSPGPIGPAGPNGTAPGAEIPLVIPYGASGTSTWALTSVLAEYATVPRTRRIVDFTNVHQYRVCTSILAAAGAGSYIELDQLNGSTWNPLTGPVPIQANGLSCAAWLTYSGALGDQVIRVSGTGSGTVAFEFVSVQLR